MIELDEPLRLCHAIIDKYSIEIFHIRETDKFIYAGIVTNIPPIVRILLSP